MNIFQYTVGLRKIPFVRDVFTIQVGSIILMAAGFLSSVAFARFLGKETFGLYAVIVAFAGTASAFFNIGQGQSLYVFFSEALGRKDRHAMASVLANFSFVASVNVVLLLGLAYIMPVLAEKFYGSRDIGMLARILCFFQISEIGNSMVLILLQSLRQIRLKVILEQTANLSYLGLAIVVLALGGKIQAVLLTQLAVSLIFLPVSLIALKIIAKRHNLPGIREVLRIRFRESSQYLIQGLLITIDKTIGNFFPQGLFFLYSLVAPAASVGVARIAVQLANIPRSILLPQAGDLSTAAFGKMKAEGVEVMRRNAAKLIKHALAFHALLSLGAAIVFPIIIWMFYGPGYFDAIPMTWWLLALSLTAGMQTATAPILRLYRKTQYSMVAGLLHWALIFITIIALTPIISVSSVFIIAYGIAQLTPLILPTYIFLGPLKKSA